MAHAHHKKTHAVPMGRFSAANQPDPASKAKPFEAGHPLIGQKVEGKTWDEKGIRGVVQRIEKDRLFILMQDGSESKVFDFNFLSRFKKIK